MSILTSKNKLTKLNKTSKGNNPSSKLGHFVPKKLVKPIYYAIFDSNMRCIYDFGGKISALCLDTLRSYKTKKIYGQHNYNNRGTKKSTT